MTELERIANEQRNVHLAKNEYNTKELYGPEHQNALSDGDKKGKGQEDESSTIGSSDDINARQSNIARNTYQKTKRYGPEHQNALSDGDEKGKGQEDENGTIGSLTDITERNFGVAKNKFNNKNQYPNFEV